MKQWLSFKMMLECILGAGIGGFMWFYVLDDRASHGQLIQMPWFVYIIVGIVLFVGLSALARAMVESGGMGPIIWGFSFMGTWLMVAAFLGGLGVFVSAVRIIDATVSRGLVERLKNALEAAGLSALLIIFIACAFAVLLACMWFKETQK